MDRRGSLSQLRHTARIVRSADASDSVMAASAMAAMLPRVASPRARASTADLGTSGRAHELDVHTTKLTHHPRLTGRRLGGRASRRRHVARLFGGGGQRTARLDPFADDPPVAKDRSLPDVGWEMEVPVTTGKFKDYTLVCSAFTKDDVPAVADLLLGSGMAGFPLEKRTLLVYLGGAVPAFPQGTYLVGRLRAPRDRTSERKKEDCADGVEAASSCDELDDDDAPMSSWSEEKSVAYGPVVATVGVSFDGATRRRFTSLSPPTDCGYLSDLTVTEAERGEGLGRAMMAAAEEFARDMRSPWMYLHVALKKPGVVRLYRDEGYDIAGFDPGILGWRGRLLMRKSMGKK